MPDNAVLVANRGEVAVRVLRSAADLGWRTCAIFAEDDADCLHVKRADIALALTGSGVAAYLDGEQILALAKEHGATAIHPGWGFLSENAEFARRCGEEGIVFLGPDPDTLDVLGDKLHARQLAQKLEIPISEGTLSPTTESDVREFLISLGAGGAVMIKAIAGGGGRGMRAVTDPDEVSESYRRCAAEALAAFGNGALYVERLLTGYRHIEMQIVGDGTGAITQLGERDCSIQRRHQKLIEIAPAVGLSAATRTGLAQAAVRLGAALSYRGLGTIEFLVGPEGDFVFMEANPRLQVEHTVTEEIHGLDLVSIQLRLGMGATLAEVGLTQSEVPPPRGSAVQVRVNTEDLQPDGTAWPTSGVLQAFDPPSGPGVRTDSHGYAGYRVNTHYDSLLAKVIVHDAVDLPTAVRKAARALREFRIDGVGVNAAVLQAILRRPEVGSGRTSTSFLDDHLDAILQDAGADAEPARWFDAPAASVGADSGPTTEVPPGMTAGAAPMPGTVVELLVGDGTPVRVGTPVLVLEAMKMQHLVTSPVAGHLRAVLVGLGDQVGAGDVVFFVEPSELDADLVEPEAEVDLDRIRPDLAEVRARHAVTLDEARPAAVAKRAKVAHRTARANLADLCDPETFVEYGALAVAAQRSRRSIEDLIINTPADGLVAGVGHVNSDRFDDIRSRAVVMSYDYTVLAGTQGWQSHRKKDRLFELAEKQRLPVVLFAEGGGGRPGDTDNPGVANLDCRAFALFAKLSGLVPTVGLVSGRCFAGNAALLGCCDVIIATPDATIGMAGPAMIEGGGLGNYRPEDIGPVSVQSVNGVIDLVVPDDAAAVQAAKDYLSYFQGPVEAWDAQDQRLLRFAIPEDRLRAYDIRSVIDVLADTGSVLELRRGFGVGMITALIRIEGRPLGLIANNPAHLGGAIDSDGADKAARFMQLCDAHGIPLLFLCDTPGFMVGPDAEKSAQVRHFARMFVVGASLQVPFFTVVLRKGYGLGAQAMAGGGFFEPALTLSWPTGEFGGMGLEGAVRLGFSKELAAATDDSERQELFDRLLAQMYTKGKAVNVAAHFELDDVIDPVDTRGRIVSMLRVSVVPVPLTGRRRSHVDTW